MRRLSRLIAFALLAWLPLQAAALPALAALCELDPARSPMHHAQHDAHHADHAHEHGEEGGAHGGDGAPGHGGSGHGCCHHFSIAAPTLAVGAPEPVPATFVAVSTHLHDFFPEHPKRPPLAAR